MAQATTVRGSQLLILVGDGEDPEVFAHPCLINAERGLAFSAETSDTNVPDCADPDAVPWKERDKRSKEATITGSGVLHAADQDMFFEWFDSEDSRNVRVQTNIAGASGGRQYAGAFQCTQFEITGVIGEKVQARITLVSDGAIVKTNMA